MVLHKKVQHFRRQEQPISSSSVSRSSINSPVAQFQAVYGSRSASKALSESLAAGQTSEVLPDILPVQKKPRFRGLSQALAADSLKLENAGTIAGQVNKTGLPGDLKAGVESISGLLMDDVRVHYNSSKPAELEALAYTQGTDIHIASGQEQHLPHEAWHVVQQKQGRVQPTLQTQGGVQVNEDPTLEYEADVMGAKALQTQSTSDLTQVTQQNNRIAQNTVQKFSIKGFLGKAVGAVSSTRGLSGLESIYSNVKNNFVEPEFEQVLGQFNSLLGMVESVTNTEFAKVESFAAEKTKSVTSVSENIGKLFETMPAVKSIGSQLKNPELLESLSQTFAQKITEQLQNQGRDIPGLLGGVAGQANSVYAAVESKVLEKGLSGLGQTLEENIGSEVMTTISQLAQGYQSVEKGGAALVNSASSTVDSVSGGLQENWGQVLNLVKSLTQILKQKSN